MKSAPLLASLLVLALAGPASGLSWSSPTNAYPEVGWLVSPRACGVTLVGCRHAVTTAHCLCSAEPGTCAPQEVYDPESVIIFVPNAGFFFGEQIALDPTYEFAKGGDLGVIRLTRPVRGVRPARLNTQTPVGAGHSGIAVGYGGSEGADQAFGVKRAGDVTTTACADVLIPEGENVCWRHDVGQTGTCYSDGGAPLLVDLGEGNEVVSIHAGFGLQSCGGASYSFGTSVFARHEWLASVIGADLDQQTCGDAPHVGEPETKVLSLNGTVSSTDWLSFEVSEGTHLLRVGLNGILAEGSEVDLHVQRGAGPAVGPAACNPLGSLVHAFCEVEVPEPGTWGLRVRRIAGPATHYQVAITLMPEGPAAALAPDGLLVSDFQSSEIFSVDPTTGRRSVLSSTQRGMGARLGAPEGLVLHPTLGLVVASREGSLVAVDLATGDRDVLSGCSDATCQTLVGDGPPFTAPHFVLVHPDGPLLVSDHIDSVSATLFAVDPETGDREIVSGCIPPGCTSQIGTGLLSHFFGMVLEDERHVIVADQFTVQRIDLQTSNRTVLSGCANGACSIVEGTGPQAGRPEDLALDSQGRLYALYSMGDSSLGALRQIDRQTGNRTQISGCQTDPCNDRVGLGPQFVLPLSIAIDADDRLWVADAGHNTLFEVDRDTGLRTARSGCLDADCTTVVGEGTHFTVLFGVATVPEPSGRAAGVVLLAVLAGVRRRHVKHACCKEEDLRDRCVVVQHPGV